MSIVAFGLSHHRTPLELLERVAMSGEPLRKVLRQLCTHDTVFGAVVLTTCNRTELYLDADRFHDSFEIARDTLSGHADVVPDALDEHLTIHYDNDAVSHLFAVSAGLDSAVIGEHEILGQVRSAWDAAREEGTITPPLDLLLRHAVEVGKRVRTETTIGRGTASVGQAAVELADSRLTGGVGGRSCVVVGAGSIANTVAGALVERAAGSLVIANRSRERAASVAAAHRAQAAPLSALPDLVADADLVVAATSAPDVLIEADTLAAATARRDRPLLVVDAALPRDVAPEARHLEHVELLDLDDLRQFAATNLAERRRAAGLAQELVAEATERHLGDRRARRAAPTVAALRRLAEDVRREELKRSAGRLGELDARQLDAVDALTQAILNKLLHAPTKTLKASAGTPQGDRLADALGELFDLDS